MTIFGTINEKYPSFFQMFTIRVYSKYFDSVSISQAAISSGGYWQSFGESPFGSNLTLVRNLIHGCGRGHRSLSGSWGYGCPISIRGRLI